MSDWLLESWKELLAGAAAAFSVLGVIQGLVGLHRARENRRRKDPFEDASTSPDGEWEYGENGAVRKRKKQDEPASREG